MLCRRPEPSSRSGDSLERGRHRWRSLPVPPAALQVPQDLVDDLVVDDEGDDPHPAAAAGADERVDLVDTLDQLGPPAAEGALVRRGVIRTPLTTSTGAISDVPLELALPPASRGIRVRAVVAHHVTARLGNVREDPGEELGRVEPLSCSAAVAAERLAAHEGHSSRAGQFPSPLDAS